MELYEFHKRVAEIQLKRPFLRKGQIMYNLLAEERPELAESIQATALDPFYISQPEAPERWAAFIDFLEKNWSV